jgi:signal recognition particle GTPase
VSNRICNSKDKKTIPYVLMVVSVNGVGKTTTIGSVPI